MAETCLIITGAPECFIPRAFRNADYVIACDHGYQHAVNKGIVPDLVVGDFDSYPGEVAPGIEIHRASPEKDDTDTLMALKAALERDFRNIVICGALGGRIDHEVANLSLCAYAAERGARCILLDRDHQIFALHNETCRIARGMWTKISVFAMDRAVTGVTFSGLKYPLVDAELTNSYPLGVSNEFIADTAEITVKNGTLLIILTDLSF